MKTQRNENKMIPASLLIEDFSLYPRHAVDDVHANDLRRVLEAGESLPPIVADRKTKRIADGWHRRRAWMRFKGPEALMPVILRNYESDADLFEDAVRMNSAHGRRLDRIDETRIAIIGERLGLTNAAIAKALHIEQARLKILEQRFVRTNGEKTPAKLVAKHAFGTKVTHDQARAMTSFNGNSLLQSVSQLQKVVSSGLFDKSDQRVLDALHHLAATIRDGVPKNCGFTARRNALGLTT